MSDLRKLLALVLQWAATIGLVIVAAFVGVWLWKRYEAEPWTRDGHVRADVVRVTTDVPGLVTEVHVADNEPVRAGQLLFVVDRPRYEAALRQADATIETAKAQYELAQKQAARDLALQDIIAAETHDENVSRVKTARAALDLAAAARATALLNVQRTEVHASVNGVVTNLDLHPGDYLAAGAQILALVATDTLRVEGYFEETRLRHIAVGDRARVRLMGDKAELDGHVESIAAGIADDQAINSGNLLPTVAPTFSWVRLAERIPVRIHIDRMPAGARLISGRTATVVIAARGAK